MRGMDMPDISSTQRISLSCTSALTAIGLMTAEIQSASGGELDYPRVRSADLDFRSYRQVSGKEINKIRGADVVDPDKNYSVSPEGLSSLYSLGVKESAETARAAAQRARANQQDKTNKAFTQIESKKAASLARAESDYWRNINGGKDEQNALSQLNAAKQDAQSAYEDEIRAAGGNPQHFEYSNGGAPQRRLLVIK